MKRWTSVIRLLFCCGVFIAAAVLIVVLSCTGARALPLPIPTVEYFPPDGHDYSYVLFTPDSDTLITYGGKAGVPHRGNIDFWDLNKHLLTKSVTRIGGELSTAILTDGGRTLIAGSSDNQILIMKWPSWDAVDSFVLDSATTNDYPHSIVLLPDRTRFIAATFVGLKICDLKKKKGSWLAARKGDIILSLALSGDGRELAVPYVSPELDIWDMEKLSVRARLRMDEGFCACAAFSPDGKWIAAGWARADGRVSTGVTLWDNTAFEKKKNLRGSTDDPYALAFTNDSKLILAATGAEVTIWTVETGERICTFGGQGLGSPVLGLSPDNHWLVTRGNEWGLRLWDFEKIRRDIGR